MRYLVSLMLGIVVGATLFVAGVYLNPFASRPSVSPLAVSEQELIDLSFSAVPAESLFYTNDGESLITPHPKDVHELWERTVHGSWATAVTFTNARGENQGFGIKFSSESESTRILNAEIMVESVWHIYLPGKGTFFVDQTENHWSYLHDIVIPARWNSGDNWRGSWHRIVTAGPGALGTARVSGGTGVFSGLRTEAVESITARAY